MVFVLCSKVRYRDRDMQGMILIFKSNDKPYLRQRILFPMGYNEGHCVS